jgi:ATP-dependent DNA ligase
VPFLREVQLPDGRALLEHCARFHIEGVVCKLVSSPYVSGPSRHWTKTKCPDWVHAIEEAQERALLREIEELRGKARHKKRAQAVFAGPRPSKA